jgi:UDP-N-acetylmuramate--alanine ligase
MTQVEGPVHLVGIGGIHMSAIAQLLMEQGVVVTGSDLEQSSLTERLVALGAAIVYGAHAAENVGEARLVVTTAAAAETNPELVEATERGIETILRAEMVARLMEHKRVIAVAGAHGKTTTSSLVAFILHKAGRDPMYLLGGESIDLEGHASWGSGDVCVVEADEYKRAFHEYEPEIAVITNIEADHLDYYGTEEAYHRAFVEFGRKVKPGGYVLPCGDDPGAAAMLGALDRGQAAIEPYGLGDSNEWRATNVEAERTATGFDILHRGRLEGRLTTTLPGRHSVQNVLAATAVCLLERVPFEDIAAAVKTFRGARRRFETVGEAGGVLVMDDYAHHPTEVRATIEAARQRFPETPIIGVHQPHTYSRIAYLWDEWISCWQGLSSLVILETFAARETPLERRGAEDLAVAIAEPPTRYAADLDAAADAVLALAKPGDVVMTIGAGDVTKLGPRILERLS